MIDDEPSEFKISMDDEIPDSILGKKPIRRTRPGADRKKPSGLLLPLSLFIILGIGIGYGYVDLRGRILGIQNAGSQMTENIAGDLRSRFSNLSIKSAKLEGDLSQLDSDLKKKTAAVDKRIATLQKAIDSLQTDSQKTRSSLDKLTVGRKPIEDKITAQSKTIDNLEKAVDPLQQAVKANKAAYETELSAIRERTNVLSKAIAPLKEANAALAGRLTLLEKTLKAKQAKSDRALNQSLDDLAAQLQALKEGLKTGAKPQKRSEPAKPATPTSMSSPAPAKPSSAAAAEKARNAPKPGQFTEQDIQ
jgi:predicted  nucleic acid-binding Zn-ribbon protein